MANLSCPPPIRFLRISPILFGLIAFFAASITPNPALATSYQQCKLGDVCKIGEFLYDDEYTPITGAGATCTLIAKNPSGTTVISGSGNATDPGDGWYHYDFATTGQPEGLYPSTLCCTIGTEDLCLDKSFEIKSEITSPTAGDIADAVLDEPVADHTDPGSLGGNLQNESFTVSDIWNNPTRTLSSFGSLAGDIWSYSTRSLSTFGSLIADIWDSSDRTLTEGGGTTTNTNTTNNTTNLTNNAYTTVEGGGSSGDIAAIKAQLAEQRKLLEVLVNEPVIINSIEEGPTPDLQEKIAKTRDTTNSLYSATQTVRSRLSSLINNWSKVSKSSALDELRFLTQNLGGELSSPDGNSVIAYTDWLVNSWDNPLTTDASNASHLALTEITTAIKNTEYYGPTSASEPYLRKALASLEKLESIVGNGSDTASDASLFGHIKKVQQRAQILEDQSKSLNGLISNLPDLSLSDLESQTVSQENQILAVNEFTYALAVLKSRVGDTTATLKNKLYSLRALLDINKALLASTPNKAIRGTWLEEGSVIFRTVITNPSKLVSQTVQLKYFLPQELKEEDILELDPSLKVSFDPEHNSLAAEGSYELGPEEAAIVFVQVEDIWMISQDELDGYAAEAETIMSPLDKSPQLAAAVEIKSKLDIALSQISIKQDKLAAPATRIRAYREAKLGLITVQEHLQELKNLASSQETASSITGFIGGSQAILAWGLIAIFLAGFAFLTLYMKSLTAAPVAAPANKSVTKIHLSRLDLTPPRPAFFLPRHIAFPLAIVAVAVVTALIGVLVSRSRQPALQAPVTVPVSSPSTASPSPSSQPSPEPAADDDKLVLGKTSTLTKLVTVPAGSSVNLRSGPGPDFSIELVLKSSANVYVMSQEIDSQGDAWTKVSLSPDPSQSWWVLSSYLE